MSAGSGRRSRPAAVARFIVTAPLARRARVEAGYCLATFPLSVFGFVGLILLLAPGLALTGSLVGAFIGLVLLGVATMTGRKLGGVHRRLAARLLGARIDGPPLFIKGRGILGRIDARLRDAAGWKGIAYLVLKPPLACWGLYFTAVPWLTGLFYLSYPFWWLVLPHQGRGSNGRFHPLPISTPFPAGGQHITTFGEALLICLIGIGALLIAPWTTRLPVIVDMWLMRALLDGSGRSDRIRELEASRARVVDDSAALLRRVERNLHDGAQARLVALTMHLGRARDQLGAGGEPGDLDRARDLMAAAHQDARAALTELRDLARGIHPPALDAGLEDALASLAAASATPAAVTAAIPVRPTPAIETIAYFCAAELLANVAKHSRASHAAVGVTGKEETLVVTVTDDGDGGARIRPGGGLEGLAQRVGAVDGTLDVVSPAGGPTVVTITLPLRA
ncbi:MAG TPA: sensor domain-containing protein [Streptosporangiaceae bacterium]|nr:sensor domain-containing protein [Streptosporangiaceae bacterium]